MIGREVQMLAPAGGPHLEERDAPFRPEFLALDHHEAGALRSRGLELHGGDAVGLV